MLRSFLETHVVAFTPFPAGSYRYMGRHAYTSQGGFAYLTANVSGLQVFTIGYLWTSLSSCAAYSAHYAS